MAPARPLTMRALHLSFGVIALSVAACTAPGLNDLDSAESGDGNPTIAGDGPEAKDAKDAKCGGATPLVAFKGGASIALRWSTIGQNAEGVFQYVVYRNDVQVATVTPGVHDDFPEKDGKGYIDKDITAGASYTYRVKALDKFGTTTELGAPLCVVAPTELAAPPKITLDTSKAPNAAAVAKVHQAFLEIWFPKLAFALALPDFTPISAYTLFYDPGYDGVAYADSAINRVNIDPQNAIDHPHDLGALLHESTHLLINSKGTPGWIVEGSADWTREYLLHDRDPEAPGPDESYLNGYSSASFFMNWIEETYRVPIVRPLNVASHSGTYSAAFFKKQTGKTLGDLWAQYSGRKEMRPGPIRFARLADKCLDGTHGLARVGTCSDSDDQAWVWGPQKAQSGTIWLRTVDGSCLDVSNGGTAAGNGVGTYGCNGGPSQQWKLQANGTLINPNSGMCLDNPNGSLVDGTKLQLWNCNGGPAQVFALPSNEPR